MAISRTQLFTPAVLPAGRLASGIRAAFVAAGQEQPNKFGVTEQLKDGSRSDSTLDVAGMDRFVDLTSPQFDVRASNTDASPLKWHYLAVSGGPPGDASIHVQAPDGAQTEALITGFLSAVGLAPYAPPTPVAPAEPEPAESPPSLPPPEARVRLRAFMSYRFGKPASDEVAPYIQRLLELLDIDVITGRSYEPRPLSAKVADRLVGLDLLVLIVGADGESAWTRDEIAAARAGGTPVVPLVAAGATFERGLFGDLEYIPFDPAHPGDVAIPLIEAVQYVRRTRE
jgi:hypothetical protein